MADIRESSPANTDPATMVARSCEFEPGDSLFAPFTPSRFRQADCDANWVPPPTVPTCYVTISGFQNMTPCTKHGDRDVKVLAAIDSLHHGYTVRAFNVLSWILPCGYENCRDYVGCMRIESTKGPGYGRPRKVLEHVKLNESWNSGFQNLSDDITRYNGFAHDRLSTALNPVDGSWFFV
ncbi:ribosomal L27e protein family [Striga asiatica]|uniref:Ribosomal L27e protein family n=1 Tax=Striga asiatica TaxID=4170 RepID=A0A5A7PUZ4_STRAF|nr:ribosomal L27e protein family [Striga asiatica]